MIALYSKCRYKEKCGNKVALYYIPACPLLCTKNLESGLGGSKKTTISLS